ncbi:MAG: hypothetical protein JSV27_03955 [Candidatus Bathyarchaeota archaeon]|nr:MAG: hypothetical protein JSV27_03955 [Candidatus Bathyarchaeota archaeon]
MTEIETFSVVIAAVTMIIASSFYILNINNACKTRQAQLFMQIHNHGTTGSSSRSLWSC